MLAWLVEEVDSPYGSVATLHWAVPDEAADGGSHDSGKGDNGLSSLNSTQLQVELESAEDQLGAVLWNSNPAALRYLHTRVFGLPCVTPSELVGSKHARETAGAAGEEVPLAGKTVVELGAGVGCLGIALAMAGARVAVTDLKELLPLMAYNVRLNSKRVAARSHGVGRCAALQWKWGPSASTSVHKQLQKEMSRQPKTATPSSTGSSDANLSSGQSAAVERVLSGMVAALAKPSDALRECSAAIAAAPSAPPSPSSPVFRCDYVIMCDALYGNPKDWPALLYTLSELLATNPAGCEIINFCEQRVNDVEGAFLRMLDDENAKTFVPASERDEKAAAAADPLWAAVTTTSRALLSTAATRDGGSKGTSSGATSSTPAAVDAHKAREDAASALLSYALVQRRGRYKWAYTTEVIPDAQSELKMIIRATRIRWTLPGEGSASARERRRPRSGTDDNDAHASSRRTEKKKEKKM